MFSVIFLPVGVLFFAQAMGSLSEVPIKNRAAKLEAYVLGQFLRCDFLRILVFLGLWCYLFCDCLT